MLAKLLTAKVAAIAAVTMLGATGAAAATGNLPTPAQNSVATALSHVGVDLPKADANERGKQTSEAAKAKHDDKGDKANDEHGNEAADDATTSSTAEVEHKAEVENENEHEANGNGPDAAGPAKFGLCTAAHVGDDSTSSTTLDKNSVAFKNLADAAAKAGQTVAAEHRQD